MAKARKFVETTAGVHLVNLAQMAGEFTLCGDAFDLEHENAEWKATTRKTVTCPRCVSVILECRGVRVAKAGR